MSINILNRADTLKKIASIGKRSNVLKSDIQIIAVSAMVHAEIHGDFTLLTKLVESVSNSNAAQLKKYISEFAPCHWVKAKGFRKSKSGEFNTDAAQSVLWDEFAKEVQKREFTYDRAAVIADLQSKIEKFGGIAAENGDGELNSALATFYQLLDKLNTALAA